MILRKDVNPPVKYLTQRDNINPYTGKKDGHNQCMVASFTMLVNWLGDKLKNKHLQVYNEFTHLAIVGKNANEIERRRYNSINHATPLNLMFENLKLKQRFKSLQMNYDEVQDKCKKIGSPIIVGSMITSYGHIIVYIGNNKWHDPYGKCSEETLSYYGKGFDILGSNVEYSDRFVRDRIFRSHDLKNTNTKRLCWWVE